MLTKRTNILFDQETWKLLKLVAKQRKLSIGETIRQAVKKTYLEDKKTTQTEKAHQAILKHRKKFKKLNYKQLINAGRKY